MFTELVNPEFNMREEYQLVHFSGVLMNFSGRWLGRADRHNEVSEKSIAGSTPTVLKYMMLLILYYNFDHQYSLNKLVN
jgi:hypothetical protein